MARQPSSADIESFRALISRRLGLGFGEDKEEFLAQILRTHASGRGRAGPAGYLHRLEAPTGRQELAALAGELTVPETYFFRAWDQFTALLEVALPPFAQTDAEARPLRILSAGCASGEETYSLAMLLLDRFPTLAGGRVSIRGIDVNPACLRRARLGRYGAWSLRATPKELQERYFRRVGDEFIVSEQVRAMTQFEERNLVENDPGFWSSGAFDIVFCRNVTMYFPPEVTRVVVSRIANALTPGGYLFLGHAETLRGVSEDFELRHTHEAFYYQRPGTEAREARTTPSLPPTLPVEPPPPVHPPLRVAELPSAPRATASMPVHSLDDALRLLGQERFAESLKTLEQLPPEARAEPRAQLLHAVLLANSGQLLEAETLCTLLFPVQAVSAMAHHLVAIARAQAGDWSSAARHDEAASRIDPTFAMPRLHLGRLARRTRDLAGARRELSRALALLPKEEASRILLFGGGFTREALANLCSAELRAVGGIS